MAILRVPISHNTTEVKLVPLLWDYNEIARELLKFWSN